MPVGQGGFALIATLMVLALLGALTAFMFAQGMSSVRVAGADYRSSRTFYAAEAAAEGALAQLEERLRDGRLTEDDLATITPPPMAGFSFEGFGLELVDTARVETVTDGPYAGLYALTQYVRIHSPATDESDAMSSIELQARAQAIPLFQFGVFFEKDLEATNGPPMEFRGRVHSNGNIYLSSANAWYREPITTPNKVFHRRKDQNDTKDGVFIDDAEGNEVQLDFDSESMSGGEAFKMRSCQKFDCRLKTDAFGTDSLNLPLPDGVPPYELLKPRDAGDSDGEKEVKYSWSADTRVVVDLTNLDSQPNQCGGSGSGVKPTHPEITVLRDGKTLPDNAVKCDLFVWNWAAFYDGREKEMKDVLEVDLSQIGIWTGGNKTREMNIIYVEFVIPADLSGYSQDAKEKLLDATLDPAVRLINGSTLPNPLTVASEWPMYVKGDYNSFMKKPAAVVGDGITILSNAWLDSQNRPNDSDLDDECADGDLIESDDDDDDGGWWDPLDDPLCQDFVAWAKDWNDRTASETTVNAGILAGHWATPCDWKIDAGCHEGYDDWYGGGLENFPRFLERWKDGSGKVPYNYVGALISPYTSQKTTGTWNGSYYNPPQRNWSFDTDFRNPALLPPGTPNVGVILRSAFREAL